MGRRVYNRKLLITVLVLLLCLTSSNGMRKSEKRKLKEKIVQMFQHAYKSYIDHAYPADELMPLSCKGRYRGSEPSRGDIDDALGNFSLTMVDTLDTLAVMGDVKSFEEAVKLVLRDVRFDSDVVVSVFETNIRMLGGLLGGHVMSVYFKKTSLGMMWYNNELLDMAKDLGYRLLPAFNSTTGVPFPRVNLQHGIEKDKSRTGYEKDTCTACAGSMLLEFAALSRMTGEPVFEDKAHRVMEVIWTQRHRTSDLVGTVINIHNGDWVRRESGIGAGIDSYYEYLLKGYILLGDESYLDRFNKHYSAIKRYVSQGPILVDVHMHRPNTASKNFMDALGAFWPGLQVLKGDIRSAIETHEVLYQVMKRHHFLPEAFTTDFRVHWGQHPLRPEFVESTYFLFKATGDPYYLSAGEKVIENLEKYARVPCGYAAIKDVTNMAHEDQMDSFVMSETFKYLYLLFSEHDDLIVDVDDYVFTTEAHLLPLTLAMHNYSYNYTIQVELSSTSDFESTELSDRSCPNDNLFPSKIGDFAKKVRHPLRHLVEASCPKTKERKQPKIRPAQFIAGNKEQLDILKEMGIKLATMNDGRVQLLHTSSDAATPEDAEAGLVFMQEMIEFSKSQQQEVKQERRVVQIMSEPYKGSILSAGPAQFGTSLKNSIGVIGNMVIAEPLHGCGDLMNSKQMHGKIVLLKRGSCMFIEKARNIENHGAIGGIVLDNHDGTTAKSTPIFAMSGDGNNNVNIPMVFLFDEEGKQLIQIFEERPNDLQVLIADSSAPSGGDAKSYSHQSQSKTYTYKDAYYEYKSRDEQSVPINDQSLKESKEPMPIVLQDATFSIFHNNEVELIIHTIVDDTTDVTDTYIDTVQHDGSKVLTLSFTVHLSHNSKTDISLLYKKMLHAFMKKTNFGELLDQGQYWMSLAFLCDGIFTTGKLNVLKEETQHFLQEFAHDLVLNGADADENYVERKCKEYSTERMPSGGLLVGRETGSHIQIFRQEPELLNNFANELDFRDDLQKGDIENQKYVTPSSTIYKDKSGNIEMDGTIYVPIKKGGQTVDVSPLSELNGDELSITTVGDKIEIQNEAGSFRVDLTKHLQKAASENDKENLQAALFDGIKKWRETERLDTEEKIKHIKSSVQDTVETSSHTGAYDNMQSDQTVDSVDRTYLPNTPTADTNIADATSKPFPSSSEEKRTLQNDDSRTDSKDEL